MPGEEVAPPMIVLAALRCVCESPPGSSGGSADFGVSATRGRAEGVWADTMTGSDGPSSAETRSAVNGGCVGAATSEMPAPTGDSIRLEEDRRPFSRHNRIGLDICS